MIDSLGAWWAKGREQLGAEEDEEEEDCFAEVNNHEVSEQRKELLPELLRAKWWRGQA